MNSMVVLFPYNIGGVWVFDDESKGLQREPFVGEMNVIIDHVVQGIPGARDGVCLYFSAVPFPGHQLSLSWRRSDGYGGNFYFCEGLRIEGWLCPAFLRYVDEPPKEIFIRADAKR